MTNTLNSSTNIVIPMAGSGTRFINEGYIKPKPFLDIEGKSMVERVLENLSVNNCKFYLIAKKIHMQQEKDCVDEIIKKFNVKFIPIDTTTEGTACTVLFARKYINNSETLLIANVDQLVDINIIDFINDCKHRNLDGSILTFEDPHLDSKWSFAKINDDDLVTLVKEKEVISKHATVGIYLFSKGSTFVDSAIDMIIHNDRVNNEFYTCPTYNYAIQTGSKIGIYNIDYKKMHGIGIPEDLNIYIDYIKNE